MSRPLTSLSCLMLFTAATALPAADPTPAEFFEREVRPLLIEKCHTCHGEMKPKGGLRLTSRANVLKGGDSGPAAIPGRPDESLLVQAIRYKDTPQMPPKEKLKQPQIDVLTRWVRLGLPWPETNVATPVAGAAKFQSTDEQRRFWSFQPVKAAPLPAVRDVVWPRSKIARFILAGLEAKGLRPAKPADKRSLIRRATFDLIGLPPTPEEVEAFVRDESPEAFAKVVDRLLASPHYGEKWGRHWLDLVRYTDSFDSRILAGAGRIMDITEAWRYRDWVVDALNHDMPYDQFVTDQIAGDIAHVTESAAAHKAGIIATGMLAIGNWGGGDADKEKLLTDIADDQLDVVSRTFMGVTLACARCHDHKFDPFSTADYYGMAGIFFSTHILPNVGPKTDGPPMLRIPLLSPKEKAEREQHQARLAAAERDLKKSQQDAYRAHAVVMLPKTANYVLAAWDHHQNPGASLEKLAGERGLTTFALRQWIDYLGFGDYQLMSKPVRNVLGAAGIHAWKGEPDCPSLTVNTTDQSVKLLTFTLPPKSVAVHPGPANGVVVGWKSPISGTVRITGSVADADPAGGDGIAWIIDRRHATGRHELASGDIANGGVQRFSAGKTPEKLASLAVQPGDMIELLVLPKANHTCDTTTVQLTIAAQDGKTVWDLTRDLLANPHQGNPHSDSLGHAGVWHFLDMANSNRARMPPSNEPALAALQRALASAKDSREREKAAAAFQKAFNRADAKSPFWITKPEDEKSLPNEVRAQLAALMAELDRLKKTTAPEPNIANGAQEGGVPGSPHAGTHDVRIHIRGSYSRLGELVPRRFPEILAGDNSSLIKEGSGRLQLARWLTRPENPLTARVMVNRIWQHHFGEGLVRTPSNFGKLGERPTHPELLDYLADQFVKGGWSIKAMHRMILLSATYQQSSEPNLETLRADPDNRRFGRMNRRRLDAEELRDSLLAVAGRLDCTQHGPASRDFNNPRRTLYQMTVRSDRSGFGPLFDVADSTALVDKRVVSTVAPQALFMMNDAFVVEQAKQVAERVLHGAWKDDQARIDALYRLLYGRAPDEREREVGHLALRSGFLEYCQVLLCANEAVYID